MLKMSKKRGDNKETRGNKGVSLGEQMGYKTQWKWSHNLQTSEWEKPPHLQESLGRLLSGRIFLEKPKSGICVYFSKISFFFKGWGRGKKKAHNIHYQAPRYCLAVILSITILPSLHFFLFMLQDLFLATSGTEKRSSEETQVRTFCFFWKK